MCDISALTHASNPGHKLVLQSNPRWSFQNDDPLCWIVQGFTSCLDLHKSRGAIEMSFFLLLYCTTPRKVIFRSYDSNS
jgi:hypothetical protein